MQSISVSNGPSGASHAESYGYSLYQEAWMSLKHAIDTDLSQVSGFIFQKIDRFIRNNHDNWLSAIGLTPAGQLNDTNSFPGVRTGQIPTALLLAGVNTPDHSLIYRQIFSSVWMQNGRVALINPGTDTASSRLLVASAVKQFLQPDRDTIGALDPGRSLTVLLDDDELFTEDNSLQSFTSTTKFTYLALSEWYHSRQKISKHQSPSDLSKETSIPAPHSRRSLSQPSARAPGRQLRSSMFPRFNQAPRSLGCRAFDMGSDVHTKAITPVSKRSSSVLSDRTKEASLDNPGPLVIILPQVESIPSHVLEEFIHLTSIYLSGPSDGCSRGLPIYLVLGLSTSPEVGFESRLCASTLGRLKTERFTVPPPAAFLETVFEALIQFPGFRLTHSMTTHLVDSLFLCLDYSVQNFLRRIRFCMLEHYLNCPNPELLLPIERARAYLTALPPTELANMLTLHYPSVTSLVTDPSISPPVSPTGRVKTKPTVVDRLVTQLASHWKVQYLVSPVLSWFQFICSSLSAQPLGKSTLSLYRTWLKNGLTQSEDFKLTLNLLSGLAKDNLLQVIDRAAGWLGSHLQDEKVGRFCNLWSPSIVQECCSELRELERTTRQWYQSLDAACTKINTGSGITGLETGPARSPVGVSPAAQALDGKQKISRWGLRQHLQQIAASSPARYSSPCSRPQTPWEQERSAFLIWLRCELSRLIPCPSNLPLHEVFYGPIGQRTTDSSPHQLISLSVRRRLNPPYQKCVHQALCDPGTYLQISQFQLDSPDSLNPALPDLCILYKLHLESTKMINLYDWLMAFATVLGEEVDREHPPAKATQARFFHGIAQLHQFGYIKPTRHKADHVMRLTWGIAV
ncbi:Origin recognition complex subunit 3 [Clonorchis sinensis]|uniref:Origin recognition complex subunit 3 n=1 Tax=Clonorchis sinensis TaxID=79923 RepID=A0A8T1MH24_CLOSI|nr:Origin recognition complex subunit 3 [Clonorchis sinensis]